jgi:outer membrane protein assembly factor BamB
MINKSTSRILTVLLTPPVITIVVGAVLAKGAFPAGAYVSGDFTVAFRSDGAFRVSEKGDAVVEGSYTVEVDRITFTDKQGRYACLDEGPGTYAWKQNGQTLAFTKVDDSCPGRERILTRQPLTKRKIE